MSLLDRNGLGDWLADRLVAIGDTVKDDFPLHFDIHRDPFLDERLRVANLPIEPQKVTVTNRFSGAEKQVAITLFRKPGEMAGTRRAISEFIKWMNYVTGNRFFTIAADLSESINMEHGSLWGHYNPETNPLGTRIKAAIQEAGNVSTAIGLVSQSASVDPSQFAGVWAMSGTYGAFTPLMYTPARVWSQQNQDSRFRMGVLHILAAHSGPETAADARTHFGIFATQVWKLFPRGQTIHLNFWDYNDVAPGYFAAAEIAARDPKVGIISIEVARPDFPGGRSQQVRRPRSQSRGQRAVRHSRFRARQTPVRLRAGAGLQFHRQSGQPVAAPGRSRDQRESHRRRQRGTVRPATGGVSPFGAASRSVLRSDGGEHGNAARVADPQRGTADG